MRRDEGRGSLVRLDQGPSRGAPFWTCHGQVAPTGRSDSTHETAGQGVVRM